MDEATSFWEAIKPLINNPVAYVIIGALIILALYMLFVKKDKRFKAVVTKILQGIIKDAYDKGIEAEFVVDDIIAKAIAKNKRKTRPMGWTVNLGAESKMVQKQSNFYSER